MGLCERRRLHRLSITGIYARIGLGLRLSRACNNKSDWLIRCEDKDALSECEPPYDKTNKMAFAPSEDSDQPGHPPSLIKVFAVRSVDS